MVEEEYKWTVFHMELADKILDYKDNRKELKRLLKNLLKISILMYILIITQTEV